MAGSFGLKIFLHRVAFISARAFALLMVPLALLYFGGVVHDSGGVDIVGWLMLVGSVFVVILPVFVFKYIVRVGCPRCGGHLDREVVGAGNYDCDRCGSSFC